MADGSPYGKRFNIRARLRPTGLLGRDRWGTTANNNTLAAKTAVIRIMVQHPVSVPNALWKAEVQRTVARTLRIEMVTSIGRPHLLKKMQLQQASTIRWLKKLTAI